MWAWKKAGSGKVYIGDASPTFHAITGGSADGKTNAAKVSVKSDSMKLVETETGKIKAGVEGVDPGLEVLDHAVPLRYYSSDRNVATVNGESVVTAKGEGSCTIQVLANNGVRASVKVKVSSAPTKLAFDKTRYGVKKGKTLDLMKLLKVTPKGTKTTYYWESSAPSVAKVSGNGVVKGLKKGKTTITVTAENGKKAKVTVVVK